MLTGFGQRTQGDVGSETSVNLIHAQITHEDVLLGLLGQVKLVCDSSNLTLEDLPWFDEKMVTKGIYRVTQHKPSHPQPRHATTRLYI